MSNANSTMFIGAVSNVKVHASGASGVDSESHVPARSRGTPDDFGCSDSISNSSAIGRPYFAIGLPA
jgi:hypothetical protein